MSRFIEVTKCNNQSGDKYQILINADHIFAIEPNGDNQCKIKFNVADSPYYTEIIVGKYDEIVTQISGR